jgi:hypothetical protein
MAILQCHFFLNLPCKWLLGMTKGEGGAHLSSRYRGMDRAAAGYLRFSSPSVGRRPIRPERRYLPFLFTSQIEDLQGGSYP